MRLWAVELHRDDRLDENRPNELTSEIVDGEYDSPASRRFAWSTSERALPFGVDLTCRAATASQRA